MVLPVESRPYNWDDQTGDDLTFIGVISDVQKGVNLFELFAKQICESAMNHKHGWMTVWEYCCHALEKRKSGYKKAGGWGRASNLRNFWQMRTTTATRSMVYKKHLLET